MKHLFTLCFILSLSVCAQAITTREDSIRRLLEGLGEQEPYITAVIEQAPNATCSEIRDMYVFGYRINTIDGEWCWSVKPQRFDLNNDYMYNQVINDTMVIYFGRLYRDGSSLEGKDSLLYCARYAMEHFNSRYAAGTYEDLCQKRYKDSPTMFNECALLYAMMAKYVLMGIADGFRNRVIDMIPHDLLWLSEIKMSNETFEMKYGFINPYKDYEQLFIDPALNRVIIPTPAEKRKIVEVLDDGIRKGSRTCALTKAFALITGLVLDKNTMDGKNLLINLWPTMQDSPFWNYIQEGAPSPSFCSNENQVVME